MCVPTHTDTQYVGRRRRGGERESGHILREGITNTQDLCSAFCGAKNDTGPHEAGIQLLHCIHSLSFSHTCMLANEKSSGSFCRLGDPIAIPQDSLNFPLTPAYSPHSLTYIPPSQCQQLSEVRAGRRRGDIARARERKSPPDSFHRPAS